MNKVSFEEIGAVAATFFAQKEVKAGQVVKMTGNGQVGPCSAGDKFCGVAMEPRKGGAAVQVKGFVTVSTTGTLTPGWAVLAADGQYTADALTGPLNGIYSAVSLEWDAMADSAEGGLFRRARLTDLLAAYGADACQDLVLIPFKTNLEDSDLTTEEYNLTGLLDYPILTNAGCFALQDTGDAAALKSAESAVLWLYSSGDGEKALTNTLGVITPWNTASDTTTLGAMQVEQVNTAILPGIDLPTAAAAQALTANEEALQGGTRGKAERTAFTQAALAALGAE